MKTETSVIHLLHRAGQIADDAFVSDITPRQYVVLEAIEAAGICNQTHLVERTGIDRSTLADIVRRLIKAKLISRTHCKIDGRAKVVALTSDGKTALLQGRAAAKQADDAILASIPASQQKAFIKGLKSIGVAA